MSRFEDLIIGCKHQKPQSMLELYNICAQPVYNTCLHVVMNEFDAEEIMQDSILKAFSNIDRFIGSQKDFVAFVNRIALNKSIDWYRKHKNAPFFIEIDKETEMIDDVDDDEMLTIPVETIRAKIEELPDGYRMVLNLHLIDELDFVDIAEIMNIQPSTVRSQYSRAKEKLRKLLINNN